MGKAALALLILLHPGLPAAQEDQQEQATALLSRAAELSNIRLPESEPFILRAQVRLLRLRAGEQEGTYTLAWESPDRWRAQIDFGGSYQDVQIVNKGRQWRGSNTNQEPVRMYEVRQVLDFASRLELRPQETVRNIRSRSEDESLTQCVEMERFPINPPRGLQSIPVGFRTILLGVPSELCFDAAAGHLVREKRRHLTNAYTDYAPWGSGLFPRTLRVFEGGTLVVEVRVSELAPLPAADPAWFALSAGAEWTYEVGGGAGGDISEPKRIHYENPDYPAAARRRRSEGAVAIEAVITSEGKVAFARFVSVLPDRRLNESAMDAVLQWRYTPALRDGQPVSVTLPVIVIFQVEVRNQRPPHHRHPQLVRGVEAAGADGTVAC